MKQILSIKYPSPFLCHCERSAAIYHTLGRFPQSLRSFGMTLFILYSLFLFFPSPAFATNTGQFTAEVWVKPTSSIASQAVLGKSEELRIFTDASGFVGCQIKATTWQTAATAGSTALTTGTWAHVACTYDKANIKVYVNGVQVATQAETDAPDDTANAFKIGQDDSASTTYTNLIGTVDNFQFYNYARTAKQIEADMGTGLAQKEPIGYWRFDEGQGTVANNSGSQGSTLNGTLTGMSSPATATSGWTNSGKYNKALIFDGGDYIQVADNIALRPTTDITISAWVNPNDFTTNEDAIVCKGLSAGNVEYLFNIGGGDGSPDNVLGFYDSAWRESSSNVLTASAWNHVVVTRNSTTVNFYVNGKNVGSVATSGDLSVSTNKLQIGVQCDNTTNAFEGSIDEVKVYPYSLTADEVKTEYNQGQSLQLGATGNNTTYAAGAANQQYCVPGDTTSCVAPVGEWNFDEGSGTSVKDTSGNNNTGTWNGGSTIRYTPGKIGSAGKFNGSDDYVDAGNGSSLNNLTGGVSVETWVKFNNISATTQTILSKTEGGSFAIHLNHPNHPSAVSGYVYAATNYDHPSFSTAGMVNEQWYHIALTYDGTSAKIWLNGVLKDTDSTYSGNIGNTTVNLLFGVEPSDGGGHDNDYHYDGSIDQVRIFNYARSAAQIAWDYNKGAPVGHWQFDECQGSVANDSSGNKNNGTITIGGSGEDTLGTCTTSSTAWGSGATGKYNSSMSFDGIDDYISISDTSFPTGTQPRTVSSWVKTSSSTLEEIISYGTGSSGQAFTVGIYGSSGIFVSAWASPQYTVTATANNGVWHHVAVSYDGANASTYMDGALLDTRSFSINTVANTGKIGARRDAGAEFFNGQIDDVKIFNYALTAAQVKTLYNNGAIFYGPATGSP